MIKITGLWKQTSKDGIEYLSGSMGQGKLLVFKNTKKQKDTDPDFTVCLAENKPRTEQRSDADESFP